VTKVIVVAALLCHFIHLAYSKTVDVIVQSTLIYLTSDTEST